MEFSGVAALVGSEFLADGGTEQAPDAVGEGQAERSADDNPRDGAADVAAAQAGAQGTGQAQSDQDGDESNRYSQAGRRQQDGQHRQDGAGSERQCRCARGLDGVGAAFIDAACLLIRAMAAGHSASEAEALADRCPGWPAAPSAAIDVFALASSRLYDEIARNDPQPFKQRLAAVTRDWACHRVGGSVSPTGRRLGSGGSC
jgi:hypothetical protein